MDIQKLREKFEKLSEIAERIDGWIAFRNDRYWNKSTGYVDQYLTGAWYAFQEQQKQINEIKAMAESWINQDYTHNSDSTDIKIQQMKDCGRDIIRKINGE